MDRKRISSARIAGISSKKQRMIHPARFVFFSSGIWKDLPLEISASLCGAYAAGKKFVEVLVASCHLAVCFVHMIQLDAGTGYKNSIGWFDSQGEFFCPIKPFEGPGSLDEVDKFLGRGGKVSSYLSALQVSSTDITRFCSKAGEEGGEVDDTNSSISSDVVCMSNDTKGGEAGKLTDECSSKVGLKDITIKDGKISSSLVVSSGGKLEKLEGDDPELFEVKDRFLAGLGRLAGTAEVTAVHKVSYDCPSGQVRREAFEKLGELTAKVRGGDANLQQAWYGCARNELLGIIKHGFGRPSENSTYGVGIYVYPERLSRLSCLGADVDENAEQHVLLCQVILGKSELVQAGSKQFHPSSDLVDTGVDNLSNPRRFIVWSTRMNTHILPLYVATFKLPRKWQEVIGGRAKTNTPVVKEKPSATKSGMTVPMLFSVLKPEVSSSEMNMVEQDYLELKNGKLSREDFLKRVRGLIGDEKLKKIQEQVLRSSILCGFLICQSQSKLAPHQIGVNAKIEI